MHYVILGKKEQSLNYKNTILRIPLTYNLSAKIELAILKASNFTHRLTYNADSYNTLNFFYIREVKKRIDRVERGLS